MPVIDHWWQTETGWAIAANCLGIEQLPVKPGSPTRPVPGYDVRVLDDDGRGAAARARSARSWSSCRCRRAPRRRCGTPTSASARSYLAAFPGYYQTADAGYIDEDGYVFVMARTDDIINVAGHRLSTGAMEEVLAAHPDVAECAVIGVADELKGQVPLGFVVLKAGVERADDEIVARGGRSWCASGSARSRRSRPRVVVERLPKTRSGQDPARHDAQDRRRRGVHDAGDDRRPGGSRRDRRGAAQHRVRAIAGGGSRRLKPCLRRGRVLVTWAPRSAGV